MKDVGGPLLGSSVVVVRAGWSSVSSKPPEPPFVVDELETGSSRPSVVVELFALGCPAGSVVVSDELACSPVVVVVSLDVLSPGVGLRI